MLINELFESSIREAREDYSSQLFESVLREADENNNDILSIHEEAEDKTLSLYKLKAEYKDKYLNNFQGKTFKNKSTELDIKISADSIRELWKKHRTRPKVISWRYLDKFIEDSKLFHYQCSINDIPYKIILTMRKAVNDIDKLRYYTLKEIKEEKIADSIGHTYQS